MTHEEHKEAVALAALGEDVGPEGREALEVHLAACGECREELRALSDTAALLAFSPAPVSPPAELRSRILTGIKATPRASGAATSTTAGSTATAAPATKDGRSAGEKAADEKATSEKAKPANVLPFDASRRDERPARRARRPALLFGYLAASLAIAALSLGLVTLWQRNNQLRADVARLSAQLQDARSQLTDTRTEMARVRGEAEMFSAPDSHVTELTGTEVASGARARLVFNETTGEAVLVAAKLPPPPAGKAYQLWYIAQGKPPMPGSVFTTDPSGRGQLREQIPPEGRRAALFAVTLEPAGGLPAPSGDIYLKGPAS
jgi:predicted anti-sigma-YlaC factor YlaD